jgi:MGT family glycosyltransferase
MRHFGFLVPATSVADHEAGFPAGDGPSVLVGLSTTYQGQERLLQDIIDALADLEVRGLASTAGQVDIEELRCPPNVAVREFVDHAAVLPDADVVVTHAGLATIAGALSRGVPLVCTPIGRDQQLNAQQVAQLGAGIDLGPDPGAGAIRSAVRTVLDDHRYREAALRIAEDSRREGGARAAVADLRN